RTVVIDSEKTVTVPIAPKPVTTAPARLPVRAIPSDAVTGDFFVQAGAFSEEANALRLVQQLSEFGEAFVTPVIVSGSQYYRVRLGPLQNQIAADNLLAQVRSYGYHDAQIVRP
ncbi:MAG: SPOR domain-containing protein, partial [Rhodospirillaceae bacterium]